MLGLARQYNAEKSVRAEDLATQQGIPSNYLIQILIELKAKGLVRSQRGKEGGYLLAKAPAEITMADILRAIHGQVFDSPALSDPHCPPELRQSWTRLQRALQQEAESITFQKLLEEGSDKEKMYYI